MSRRRPSSVRLLIGCNAASKSVVRLGPFARSRTTSIVHLSPTICSAPAIGQPSPSRRRITSRTDILVCLLKLQETATGRNACPTQGRRLVLYVLIFEFSVVGFIP